MIRIDNLPYLCAQEVKELIRTVKDECLEEVTALHLRVEVLENKECKCVLPRDDYGN